MQVKLFPDDSKSSKEPQVMSEWRKTQKSAYKQARSVPLEYQKLYLHHGTGAGRK